MEGISPVRVGVGVSGEEKGAARLGLGMDDKRRRISRYGRERGEGRRGRSVPEVIGGGYRSSGS